MVATQQVVPMHQFAQAMLEADSDFAARVQRFADRFGAVDANGLAVLAQAIYCCWGNAEYRDNFIGVCGAIGAGRPTSFYYHCQIAPARWAELHGYVVGVQRWLGVNLPLPPAIDAARVERAAEWLDGRGPARGPLAVLFLERHIGALGEVSFARLGGEAQPGEGVYADFSGWDRRPDGTRYASGDRAAFRDDCTRRIRGALRDAPADAEALIEGILKDSPPPCVHRYTRYLDIQLASVGALTWRGNLPPNAVPLAGWQAFLEAARAGWESWLAGAPPPDDLAAAAHRALGMPTERKRAIVRGFLAADRLGGPSFDWLQERARAGGYRARAAFAG